MSAFDRMIEDIDSSLKIAEDSRTDLIEKESSVDTRKQLLSDSFNDNDLQDIFLKDDIINFRSCFGKPSCGPKGSSSLSSVLS